MTLKININNLLFVAILLFSLNTYYFYQVGLPIIQMLGLYFLGLYIINQSIDRIKFKKLFYLLTFFIVYVSIFSIINLYLVEEIASPIALLGFIIGLFVFLISFSVNLNKYLIYKYLNVLAFIFIAFWFIQFAMYYVIDYKIDYFIDIVGYPQRTNIGVFESSFFRPASLFIEPAMYTNAMLLLFFYRLLYNDLKMDKTNFIILFTIVFTMSSYGYIVFATLLIFVFVSKKKNIPYFIFGIFTFVTLFYLFELYNHPIILRVMNPLSDMSGQIRTIGSIFEFFDLNIFNILFGFGWGNAEINGFQGSAIHYLLYNIGLLGVLLFMSIFLLILRGNRYQFLTFIFLVLGLLNNSSVCTSFFFWLMIGFIFQLTKKQDYKNGTTL